MSEQSIVVCMAIGLSQEYRDEVVVWDVQPEGDLVIQNQDGRVIGTHARGHWLYVQRVVRIEDLVPA